MFPPPYFRRSSSLPYPTNNFRMPPPINRPSIPQGLPPGLPPGFPPNAAGAAPSKLDQFLKTTDQIMRTAKTYEPYIQQARPLLKNLPAMWKLYKGFTSTNDTSTQERPRARQRFSDSPAPRPTTPVVENPSVPRIYQPPFN